MQEKPTRKRRRRAVDPSIGYYIFAGDTSRRLDLRDKLTHGDSEDDTPLDIKIMSGVTAEVAEKPRLASPPIVGVEQFLRTLAQEKHISAPTKLTEGHSSKKPGVGHGPTLNVLQLRSRQVTRTKLPHDISSPDSLESYEGKTRKYRQRRVKRPFKQRIYEAAVATHADPVIALAQPRGIAASRPPLHFEPLSPPPQTQRERRGVVTSVTSVNLLRQPSFSRPGGPDEVKFPITHWKTYFPTKGCSGGVRNESKRRRPVKAEEVKREAIGPLPLSFVPLSQAEAGYKVMFQDSIKQSLTPADLRSRNMEEQTQPLRDLSPEDRQDLVSSEPVDSTALTPCCDHPTTGIGQALQPLPMFFDAFISNLKGLRHSALHSGCDG